MSSPDRIINFLRFVERCWNLITSIHGLRPLDRAVRKMARKCCFFRWVYNRLPPIDNGVSVDNVIHILEVPLREKFIGPFGVRCTRWIMGPLCEIDTADAICLPTFRGHGSDIVPKPPLLLLLLLLLLLGWNKVKITLGLTCTPFFSVALESWLTFTHKMRW